MQDLIDKMKNSNDFYADMFHGGYEHTGYALGLKGKEECKADSSKARNNYFSMGDTNVRMFVAKPEKEYRGKRDTGNGARLQGEDAEFEAFMNYEGDYNWDEILDDDDEDEESDY